MKAITDAEKGEASILQVIFVLEETSQYRKRIETEFNNSFESGNNKIDKQKVILDSQTQEIKKYM